MSEPVFTRKCNNCGATFETECDYEVCEDCDEVVRLRAELARVTTERDQAIRGGVMDRTYRDSDGNRVDLAVLCRREPGWATNRILELTRQVDALLRGNEQMRLLAQLPLPPDVIAKLREADRLRKLFDDAGEGQYNVLNLVESYQRTSMEADERLRAVRKLLEDKLARVTAERDQAIRERDELRAQLARVDQKILR